jgi:hypothetical protein
MNMQNLGIRFIFITLLGFFLVTVANASRTKTPIRARNLTPHPMSKEAAFEGLIGTRKWNHGNHPGKQTVWFEDKVSYHIPPVPFRKYSAVIMESGRTYPGASSERSYVQSPHFPNQYELSFAADRSHGYDVDLDFNGRQVDLKIRTFFQTVDIITPKFEFTLPSKAVSVLDFRSDYLTRSLDRSYDPFSLELLCQFGNGERKYIQYKVTFDRMSMGRPHSLSIGSIDYIGEAAPTPKELEYLEVVLQHD